MFKFTKKKTIIGLCGLIVSIGLATLFGWLSPSGNIIDLNVAGIIFRILSLIFFSSAGSFIFYIFTDIKVFFLIFGAFVTMMLFRVLLMFTSKSNPSISIFIISLVGVILLIISAYNQYKSNNFAINGDKVLSSKEKIKQEKLTSEIKDFIKEDEEFKNSIGYLENSIIIGTQAMGTLYQVIKTNSGLLFHHIGNILKGINKDKLIKDFNSVELDDNNKKDYLLKYEDIDKISATIKNNNVAMDYGNLKITLKSGKSKRYGLINLLEENELKTFFKNIEVVQKLNKTENEECEISEEDKTILNRLNILLFILSIVSSLAFGGYFILYTKIAHAIVTTLCNIACLMPIVLYFIFPKYLSLKDKTRYDSNIQNGKLNIIQNSIIFPSLLCLFSLFEGYAFVHYDIIKLLIYSGILFVVLFALFLLCSKEYKKEKSVFVI